MSNPIPTTEASLRPKPAEPSYPAPKHPPNWETDPLDDVLEKLKQHLQTAVLIELYTIPMYLFSYYSIIEDPKSQGGKIRNIALQEMLHLALSGNILCSIGGTPLIFEHTPEFPTKLFYESDSVLLNLESATRATIKVFVDVERPEFSLSRSTAFDNILPDYGSIGEFYQEVIRGITILHDRMKQAGRELFLEPTFVKQYQGGYKKGIVPPRDNSWEDSDLAVIKTLEDATTALKLIITQGEGSYPGIAGDVDSHHAIFESIHDDYHLVVKNVPTNINPDKYKTEKFHVALLTADAIYSYLLLTIEKLWLLENRSRRLDIVTSNFRDLMSYALSPLAQFLVKQPITSEPGNFAGPPFRKYDFGVKSAKDQLKDLIQNTVTEYPGEKTLVDIQTTIGNLVPLEEIK